MLVAPWWACFLVPSEGVAFGFFSLWRFLWVAFTVSFGAFLSCPLVGGSLGGSLPWVVPPDRSLVLASFWVPSFPFLSDAGGT